MKQRAQQLFTPPLIDDPHLLESGHIGKPIPLQTPTGTPHSWFIPVLIFERLSGFFQFTGSGEFMRYSSFCTRPGSFDNCPPADAWLSEEKIMKNARRVAHQDETLPPPFLSYDSSPERIVWIVRARSPDGKGREIMVAGDVVYVGNGQRGLVS